MHVAVAPVGTEDAAAPSRFIEANANRAGSTTKHVGTEWVDLADLLNYRWRKENVHYHQALMTVAVRDTLQKHVVSGDTVLCGEKRSRDAFFDSDENAAELDAMMTEVESGVVCQ